MKHVIQSNNTFKALKLKLTKALHYFTSLGWFLLSLFAASIVFILVFDIWLIEIPEIFPKASVFGRFFYNLSFATIVSVFFYFLTVHLPRERVRLKTYLFLANKIVELYNDSGRMLELINPKPTRNVNPKIYTLEFIQNCCKKINPHSPVRTVFVNYPNWFIYLNEEHKKVFKSIRDILFYKDVLSYSLIEKLSYMENEFEYLNFSKGVVTGNQDIEVISHSLFRYYNLIKDAFDIFKKDTKLVSKIYNMDYRLKRSQNKDFFIFILFFSSCF